MSAMLKAVGMLVAGMVVLAVALHALLPEPNTEIVSVILGFIYLAYFVFAAGTLWSRWDSRQ